VSPSTQRACGLARALSRCRSRRAFEDLCLGRNVTNALIFGSDNWAPFGPNCATAPARLKVIPAVYAVQPGVHFNVTVEVVRICTGATVAMSSSCAPQHDAYVQTMAMGALVPEVAVSEVGFMRMQVILNVDGRLSLTEPVDFAIGGVNFTTIRQTRCQGDTMFTIRAYSTGQFPDGSDALMRGADCDSGSFYTGESCAPCPLGKFSNVTGVHDCDKCQGHGAHKFPRGTYGNGTGQTACTPCAANLYTANSGLSECAPCDAGRYLNLGESWLSICVCACPFAHSRGVRMLI
jgi:hypothetical protein